MTPTLANRVYGLHCAEEIRAIQETLAGRPGVLDLQFDLLAEKLVARLDVRQLSPDEVRSAIAALGMRGGPWAVRVGPSRSRRWRTGLAVTSGVCLSAGLLAYAFESGSLVRA